MNLKQIKYDFKNIENKEIVMQKSQEFLKNALNI